MSSGLDLNLFLHPGGLPVQYREGWSKVLGEALQKGSTM